MYKIFVCQNEWHMLTVYFWCIVCCCCFKEYHKKECKLFAWLSYIWLTKECELKQKIKNFNWMNWNWLSFKKKGLEISRNYKQKQQNVKTNFNNFICKLKFCGFRSTFCEI